MTAHIFDHNRAAWDRESSHESEWSRPVAAEAIERARGGQWDVVLTPRQPVPRSWFGDLAGKDVLCLASGGGQQAPILAAAGARVTSLDASAVQLGKDREVSERHHLDLRCEQGDMADLARFADASFDLVFHPCSNCFVPDVMPVWRECARVLRPGGVLLSGFLNPLYYLFDHEAGDTHERLQVRYSLPYADVDHPDDRSVKARLARGEALEFSHTLDTLIGGQLRAGFVLADLYEDWWSDEATPLNRHCPTSIATLAVKPVSRHR